MTLLKDQSFTRKKSHPKGRQDSLGFVAALATWLCGWWSPQGRLAEGARRGPLSSPCFLCRALLLEVRTAFQLEGSTAFSKSSRV